MKSFFSSSFFGVTPEFLKGIQLAINNTSPNGIFAGDNLFTIGRNLGFLDDKTFMDARRKYATTDVELSIAWRHHVLAWAAKSVLARNVPGDFVECACYKGTSARIVCDFVDFAVSGRTYYLYDLFEHDEMDVHHAMPEHGKSLFETVRNRFADLPNVVVTKGHVPQILDEISPATVSFLHIDLNNALAEIGALDRLFSRLSPGGILVLDDYGWAAYQAQKLAEDPWLAERGYQVLELPTGQGVVIK